MQVDKTYTGGDIIVQALKAAGIDTIFGVISIHNIPIYDAMARQGGIRVITNRGEAGAVNMADGYAKATSKLGVAITSTGSGVGTGAGALIEAQTNGTPLLHITGQIDSPYLDQGKGFIHEGKGQFALLQAISKAAFRVSSINSLSSTIQHAIELAQAAPTGLVSVEIPIDIQKMHSAPAAFHFIHHPPLAPDPFLVKQAAESLLAASRPLIWSGNGVIQSGAAQALTQLAETCGAGVLTSLAGRGVLPEDHPQCIGNFANHPAIRDFLTSCDVLLAVGTRLRGAETLDWQLPLPPTIIQIDVDRLALGRNYPATIGIAADARLGLQMLIAEIEGRIQPDRAYLQEVQTAKQACRTALGATLGPYEQLCYDLRSSLKRDASFQSTARASICTPPVEE